MPPPELRRWLPVTVLAAGAAVGLYYKRSQSHSVEPTAPLQLPREEHCDPNGWCAQTLPGGPARETTFAATWAAGADDVWAVGLTGVAVHWDGARWSSVPTNTPILRGVYGFATNDVWLVGRQRALHWDGTQLVPHEIAVSGELTEVYGTSSNDIWTVSTSGQAAHWDGKAWQVTTTAFPGWLEAVWGAAPDDYWASGGYSHDGAPGVVARWNGATWALFDLPCDCAITALSGTAADDIWAVGSWGKILHYDGRAWTLMPSPAKRGLMGVWANSPRDVWAVGEESLVLHYDGKAWTGAKPDWKWLRGVTATPTDVWAVGQDGWVLRLRPSDFKPTLPSSPTPGPATPTANLAPHRPEIEQLSAAEADALVEARTLQKNGHYEAARSAFVLALGQRQTLNLQPLAELAFLMASHQVGDPDEIEGAFLTAANSRDTALQAPAWYNLSSFYQTRNRPEKARAALARSVLRRNRIVAAGKLAGRSPCLAEMGSKADAHVAMPTVVTGWRGVCEAIEQCARGEPLDEAAARARVCSGASTSDGQSPTCDGDGPWELGVRTVPTGRLSAWVFRLPNALDSERFFVGRQQQQSQFTTCVGASKSGWQQVASYAQLTVVDEPLWPIPGRPKPGADAENGICGRSATTTTTGVFSLDTATPLALVSHIDEYPVTVTVEPSSQRLSLKGSQCDGYIALDGAMQWTPDASRDGF